MAQKKFSELTAITTRDSTTELVVLHQGDNNRITADNFLTGISGGGELIFSGTTRVLYDTSTPFVKDIYNCYIQFECDEAMYGMTGDIEFELSPLISGLAGLSTDQNLFLIDSINYPAGSNDYYCQGNYDEFLPDFCDNVPGAVLELVQYNVPYTQTSERYDSNSIRTVIKDDGTGRLIATLPSAISSTNRFFAVNIYNDTFTNAATWVNPLDLQSRFDDPFERIAIRSFAIPGSNKIFVSSYVTTAD